MAAISNSLVLTKNSPFQLSHHHGSSMKPVDQFLGSRAATKLPLSTNNCVSKKQLLTSQRPLAVRAGNSEGGRPNTASIFVGGFVLGGIIVGTLGCVYAPKISKALGGADRKDLMRKLPKFIYDEEKALEKTRKVLTEKIAQLNSAIDDVSSQLRSEDNPNGAAALDSDEVETAI